MVCVVFSVCWCYAHECLFLVMHFLCIWSACDFMFQTEVWKGERMSSIVSLSEPGDSCKVCSWIHLQGVHWWRLGSLTLDLIHPEVEVSCWSYAGSAQAEEEVSVVKMRKGDWRLLLQKVRRVGRIQHLRSCWTSSARRVHESIWRSQSGKDQED